MFLFLLISFFSSRSDNEEENNIEEIKQQIANIDNVLAVNKVFQTKDDALLAIAMHRIHHRADLDATQTNNERLVRTCSSRKCRAVIRLKVVGKSRRRFMVSFFKQQNKNYN